MSRGTSCLRHKGRLELLSLFFSLRRFLSEVILGGIESLNVFGLLTGKVSLGAPTQTTFRPSSEVTGSESGIWVIPQRVHSLVTELLAKLGLLALERQTHGQLALDSPGLRP